LNGRLVDLEIYDTTLKVMTDTAANGSVLSY
jgi:hypothetical protein